MATYFITRHLGALQWATTHHIYFDHHLDHLLDLTEFHTGDVIIGTLPINIVYQLNEQGVRYINLSLEIPSELRGVELDVEQLNTCKAQLEEYFVTKVGPVLD